MADLTSEIEKMRVSISRGGNARIDAIRDLLREFPNKRAESESSRSIVQEEPILTDKQKRWLEPPGLVDAVGARILFFANRTVMRQPLPGRSQGLDRLLKRPVSYSRRITTSYLDPPALGAVLSNARLARTYWGDGASS